MSTDWRALCAELAAELERCRPRAEVPDCLARARASLTADGPAVPEGREPASVATQPSDEEIMGLMPQQMHDDLAAAVRAMAEQEGIDSTPAKGVLRIILNRHVVDLARAALARWGRPAALAAAPEDEPSDDEIEVWADQQGFIRGHGDHPCGFWIDDGDAGAFARAVLARYGHQPAPPAAGEQRHPTPVPVPAEGEVE